MSSATTSTSKHHYLSVVTGLIGILTFCEFAAPAQVREPLKLPARFHKMQYPQTGFGDCGLPFTAQERAALKPKTYTVGRMKIRVETSIQVTSQDMRGLPWSVDLDIRQAGCWMYFADLDGNRKIDLITVTSDGGSGGDSLLTILMIDSKGKPVPWQAFGYFRPNDHGVGDLVDLAHDGKAGLLYLQI